MRQIVRGAAVGLAVLLLGGCGATKEMKAARENGIALLESGDYEGAIQEFDRLIESAGRVSDFELDVLKYRAEAEFALEDFEAAAHTYDILSQVDGEKAEYYYFGAVSLAGSKKTEEALALLEKGRALDESGEKDGFTEAMLAVGAALSDAGAEGADGLYNELIQSGRADTRVYNRLALLSMKAGEYETALKFCEEGLALPDAEAARELAYNRAVCYEYLGRYEEALTLFEDYVAEFGSDEKAEHEIAFLKTR